jgi:plastocyanin
MEGHVPLGHSRKADFRTAAIAAGAAALGWPVSLAAGPVSGVVRTETRPGVAPAAVIVYAEPVDAPAPRRPGRFTLTQRQKTFMPPVLAVPVGSTVTFPNEDVIFHNVFSLSGPEPFDLGLYRAGASRARVFNLPGAYRVFCNIHPQMTALIVVVPTPYVALAAPGGRYVLDLPPGRYRLTVLSAKAAPVTTELQSAAGASEAPLLTLDESQWVATPHKNKFGQDYPAAAYKPGGPSGG